MSERAPQAPHDEPRWPREAWVSWAIVLLALLPRLYVAIAWAREPVWDGHYYDFGARRIAAGLGYSDDVMIGGALRWHPWCHYPVGYSGFLAAAYAVFGAGPKVATIANAVVGAGLAGLVHQVGARALGPVRGRIAGVLVALSPELVAYAALLMTEPLASLAPIAAALFPLALRDRRPLLSAALAGVCLGLGALVRPQTLLCVPGLFLIFACPDRLRATARSAALATVVAGASALAVVAPWTARNCRVMDGCALVSTNAGWNLAIGALPRATGRFETLRAADGCPVVTGQVQQDRCWGEEGLAAIRRDPLRWLGLVPKKLSFTFDHASFAMGYLGEADRARFTEPRKETGRTWLTATHRALLVLAALAAAAAPWRRRGRERVAQIALLVALGGLFAWLLHHDEMRPFWIVAAITPALLALPLPGAPRLGPLGRYLAFSYAAVVVTHAVFFGEDRYHVFLVPVLALLAASALREEPRSSRPADASA